MVNLKFFTSFAACQPQLYEEQQPMLPAKYDDFTSLCNFVTISREYRPLYESLLHNKKANDLLVEPDANEHDTGHSLTVDFDGL